MNKVLWIVGACTVTAVAVTGGIGIKNGWFTKEDQSGDSQKTEISSPCEAKKIDIEGYGDKGEQLKNCFVEYPGEPTREDKSYYIVEDICGQFTQSFMKNMSGLDFDTNIPMDNFVIYQEDGLINSILLILNENKYIRVDRSSSGISEDVLLRTATNIAKEIKDYK